MFLTESLPYSADLADFWLGRAVLHLATTCGMSEATLDELAGGVPVTRPPDFDLGTAASLRRLDAARMVVLCSALASEAAVNGYIHGHGSPYRGTLEKLSPPERLALAPNVVSGCDPFPVGSRLHQQIVRLFELRDELVRPWQPSDAAPVDTRAFERYSAPTVLQLLEASARAIEALAPLYAHPCGRAAGWALRVARALSKRADAAAALPTPTQAEIEEAARQIAAFPAEIPVGA